MASGDKIYEQLNSLTLADVSGTNINLITQPIHLEKLNEDALKTTVLLNQATMRDGLPMPGYGKVVQTTGDADRIQFQPEKGEVWLCIGGDWLSTSGTSAMNVQLTDADGNTTLLFSESTSGQVPLDALGQLHVVVTNTLFLYANITSGEGRLSTAFVRVR